ncbi:sigma-54-dependent transcriptional regulator [Desulfoluna spongiiphila]|uniref:Two component, sigma54 specific, transcriptional regulator, Fis family n=1 Tax=Desulfoluna spongiiphila TaxID=419481 RepID=A0A1G5JEL3_9BACT|nr:sigma-54 dependent transcriptional regulator [Desulfoluna spongiiphila]SCY86168.1 two component, sigma54 specific, transcriptional regulator, Fis family [Desulfoluna spongiiphila]
MPKKPQILVVDDDLGMREFLELMLTREGYGVTLSDCGKDAVKKIRKTPFDLILTDIRLGDLTGLDVLRAAKEIKQETAVVLISAYATTETAVEAMNEGAYDYVPKPFDNEELKDTLKRALELQSLAAEKEKLSEETQEVLHFGTMIGSSGPMRRIYTLVEQVAGTRTNVLITGESGTGKELIARSIHTLSGRKDKPFVAVNCGGIPETLMESELFGHLKGSFTGATHDKKGLFEEAEGGTVFLDEIGELSVALQVKLLRVVQERKIKPVGGTREVSVDTRIICATNKNLEEEVMEKRFRKDLFYRLNVIEIRVPSLRERKADLKPLAQFFLEKYAEEMGKDITKISSYAIDLLKNYDFPGNVRELENLIERSVALSATNIILPESLSMSSKRRRWIEGVPRRRFDLDDVATGVDLPDILEAIEKAYMEKALEYTKGNKSKAAELLGLSFRSFRYRCDKLNIL